MEEIKREFARVTQDLAKADKKIQKQQEQSNLPDEVKREFARVIQDPAFKEFKPSASFIPAKSASKEFMPNPFSPSFGPAK